ncbi:MAG: hypothetical protein ABI239_06045 [Aquihabitans sp.]
MSASDGPTSRPENDDPSLADGYPPWIHFGPWITASTLLAPWRAPITKQLAAFDVVVSSGPGPIFAQFAGRPWAFYATGGDLTVKPFPLTFWRWYPSWPHRAAEVVAGGWQRRALRRADQVWLQPFAPMVDAADRLRVPQSARSDHYFPIVLDTDAYQPDADPTPTARAYVDESVGDAELVIFHPSRLVTEASDQLVRTGQWKGNDTLIRGFAEFVKTNPHCAAVLVMPDTPLSRDVDGVRLMVEQLGISEHVRWLVPPGGRLFDRQFMHALYQRSDVVADEFGVGWFGYVTLEGLAMGKPVVGNIDQEVMGQLYPEHPIVAAATPAEVADRLSDIAGDLEGTRTEASTRRQWVIDHHSAAAAAAVYKEAIVGLAAGAAT